MTLSQESLTAMTEERSVIKRIMDGDANSFEVILRKYSPRVFAMVGRKVPSEDVESVAQDVFLSAYRSLGSYESRQPLEHWLARIVRRRCCDYWREREHARRMAGISLDDPLQPGVEYALSRLSEAASRGEAAGQVAVDEVHQALGRLEAEDRALIESVYFEDLPLKEVAATFEWSLVKTKVRAHRARKKLRTILESTGTHREQL